MTVKTYQRDTAIGERLENIKRIKVEIDRLNEELDKQKAFLLAHAIRNDYDSLRLEEMILTRRTRTTWVYSANIRQSEAKLKQRKLKEQNDGTAIGNSSEHLVVTFDTKALLAHSTRQN